MIALIRDIIHQFGPRLAGSEAENNAQLYLKNKLSSFATSAEQQFFEAPLTAKFRKMKIYATLYWLSVLLLFFNPFIAAIIAIANAFITVSDLMRNGTLLDFLFPTMQSSNVTATVEPTNTAQQTIVFAGHIDSTEECQWWFWLKQTGGYLTFICGILIIALAIYATINLLWLLLFSEQVLSEIKWLFLALSPVQIVYFTFHSKKVVEGAADNLSGIAIAFELLKYFHENKLKNTRIRFISFGAEEKGLRGSKAYVKKNLNQLNNEKSILINIDTIRVANDVSIVHKETMIGVNHNEALVKKVKASFDNLHFPCRINPLPMGGTDAVPFSMNQIPAISIIGLNTQKLDPTYHTRLDTLNMLEPQALVNVKQALIHFTNEIDTSISQ